MLTVTNTSRLQKIIHMPLKLLISLLPTSQSSLTLPSHAEHLQQHLTSAIPWTLYSHPDADTDLWSVKTDVPVKASCPLPSLPLTNCVFPMSVLLLCSLIVFICVDRLWKQISLILINFVNKQRIIKGLSINIAHCLNNYCMHVSRPVGATRGVCATVAVWLRGLTGTDLGSWQLASDGL